MLGKPGAFHNRFSLFLLGVLLTAWPEAGYSRLPTSAETAAAFKEASTDAKASAAAASQNAAISAEVYCQSPDADARICGEITSTSSRSSPQCDSNSTWTGGSERSGYCAPNSDKTTQSDGKPADGKPGSGTESQKAKKSGPSNQDHQVSSQDSDNSSQCRSNATSAASTCESAVNQIQSLRSQVNQSASQMQNQSASAACGQMASSSNSVANQMQSLRDSCQQAVSSCSNLCPSAVNSLQATPNSAAYIQASDGLSKCQNASARLNAMDMNINEVRSVSRQANQCYADATGSPMNLSQNGQNGQGTSSQQASDCSNPQIASTDPVCRCRANPSLNCATGVTMADAPKNNMTSSSGTRSTSSLGGDQGLTLGEPTSSSSLPSNYQKSQTQLQQANGQGGTGAGSSRAGSSGGNPSQVGGAMGNNGSRSPRNVNVYGGVYDGSSGGQRNMAQYQMKPSFAPRADQVAYQNVAGRGPSPRNTVDLRRFLPSRVSRGPSSVSTNGIGGAHTNFFSTVRARYIRVAESLNP